jgi:GNAT superfamily N-acetyltransferase
VRPAQASDLDRLVELMQALQDHIEAANRDLWRMTDRARTGLKGQLHSRLTASNACVLVAVHDKDGVVGAIFGRVVTNNRYTPARAGLVDQIVVAEGHRRMGVGTRLMADLCRFFSQQGVEDLSLRYVVGNEEAAHFWEALGFAARIVTMGARRQDVEESLICIER